MEIYGTGKSKDGNIEVQWEAMQSEINGIEFSDKLKKDLKLNDDQVYQIEFELKQAIVNARKDALKTGLKYVTGKYNGLLENYLTDIKDRDTSDFQTLQENLDFSKEMNIEMLIDRYNVRDYEELMENITDKDREEYGL